jgi:O-antigen/teichoic acid export membrane protein
MLIALLFGASALLLALVMLVITVLWSAIYIFLGRRTLRRLVLTATQPESSPRNERRLFAGLIWQGLGYQAGALWQAILFQGSIVVAGSVLGTSGAALWGAMRVVIRSGNQFLELIGQTVAPEFQAAYAQRNYDRLRKDYRTALTAAVISAACIVLLLLIVGPRAFNWWTRNSFTLDYAAWSIFCLSLLPFSLWWCGGVLQGAVNRPWLINAYGVGSAALCVVLMRLLGGGGMVYISACALLFDLMMAVFVLPQSLKLVRAPQAH